MADIRIRDEADIVEVSNATAVRVKTFLSERRTSDTEEVGVVDEVADMGGAEADISIICKAATSGDLFISKLI